MHCLNGEDESFEICETTFPEEATITCIENRQPGFDIWIKAIPCDGIWECKNGSDEVNCEGNMYNLVLIVVLLVIFTNCIYFYLKLKMIPQWKIDFQSKDDDNDDNWNPDLCQTYMGDKLAKLKVSIVHKSYHFCVKCYVVKILSFRMKLLKRDVLNCSKETVDKRDFLEKSRHHSKSKSIN